MESFYKIDQYPFDKVKAQSILAEFLSNDQLGCLFLVQEAETPVGYLALTYGFSFEYGGRDAFIDEFFLTEKARGRGIGSQVMTLLHKEAQERGVKTIHLEVEPDNVIGNRIYQKAGYTSNGRTLMTKKVDDK